MIDFHSHILPKVDDGSDDLDMSMNMLQHSVKEGTEYICATPHYIQGEYEISRDKYITDLNNLKQNAPSINILTGLELYISPDLVNLYRAKKIWGINDTKYLLIELPMNQFPLYTEDILYNLRLEGLTPIIAHPERNTKIIDNVDLLIKLVNEGTLVQMNAGSLIGIYGSYIKKFAEQLVDMNLVHVLGSDAHNDTKRTTRLKEGFEILKTRNPQLYNWILKNEKNIINGKEIESPMEILIKKPNIFKRLFKL